MLSAGKVGFGLSDNTKSIEQVPPTLYDLIFLVNSEAMLLWETWAVLDATKPFSSPRALLREVV